MIPYTTRFLMAIRSSARNLSTPQLAMLQYLAGRANEAGETWPSIDTIAEDIGRSERQVRRTLDSLAADGWIVRSRIGDHGQRRLYRLNLSLHSTLAPRQTITPDRYVHCSSFTPDTLDLDSGQICPTCSSRDDPLEEDGDITSFDEGNPEYSDLIDELGPISRAILATAPGRWSRGRRIVDLASLHHSHADHLRLAGIPWLDLIDEAQSSSDVPHETVGAEVSERLP